VRWLSLACALQGALVALALTGCESSQEKSAKLEREAKLHLKQVAETEVTITRPSTRVQATSESVVTSSEGSAAVVMLHNSSAAALADVPILITVRDAQGATVYTNKAPGLTPTSRLGCQAVIDDPDAEIVVVVPRYTINQVSEAAEE